MLPLFLWKKEERRVPDGEWDRELTHGQEPETEIRHTNLFKISSMTVFIQTFGIHIHHSRLTETSVWHPVCQRCWCRVIWAISICFLLCRMCGQTEVSKDLSQEEILKSAWNGQTKIWQRHLFYQETEELQRFRQRMLLWQRFLMKKEIR